MGRNLYSLDMYINQVLKISHRVDYQVQENNNYRNEELDAFIVEFMEDYYAASRSGLLNDNFKEEQEPLKTLYEKYKENIIFKSSLLLGYFKDYQELLSKKVQGNIGSDDENRFFKVRNDIVQIALKMGTYYYWLIANE